MIHVVGLFEPNAFSRTFKPGTLIRPGNYILSRRGVACVNGAQRRLRDSVTVLIPSCRSDSLSGVVPHTPQAAAGTMGSHLTNRSRRLVSGPWGLAISPRGDMLKNRVPLETPRTQHALDHHDFHR